VTSTRDLRMVESEAERVALAGVVFIRNLPDVEALEAVRTALEDVVDMKRPRPTMDLELVSVSVDGWVCIRRTERYAGESLDVSVNSEGMVLRKIPLG
jgi:hypothetical protein